MPVQLPLPFPSASRPEPVQLPVQLPLPFPTPPQRVTYAPLLVTPWWDVVRSAS